jgi:hypothetical protein
LLCQFVQVEGSSTANDIVVAHRRGNTDANVLFIAGQVNDTTGVLLKIVEKSGSLSKMWVCEEAKKNFFTKILDAIIALFRLPGNHCTGTMSLFVRDVTWAFE